MRVAVVLGCGCGCRWGRGEQSVAGPACRCVAAAGLVEHQVALAHQLVRREGVLVVHLCVYGRHGKGWRRT